MSISRLFQNLREYQIDRESLKSADLIFPQEAIASFREFEQLFSIEFDEAGQQLKSLLEKGYQDGIDGLENVRVENGKIKGIFIDKVTPNLTKRYEFTIDENAVKYKLVNPDAVEKADFTELEFARTKLAGDTKKKKNCPNGTSCRYSCISKLKECSYVPSTDEKGEITYLKQKLSKKDKSEAIISRPTTGKKTAIALLWEGAWNNAPDDLKRVLDIIDEPEEATEDLFGCAYQTDGKIYMHKYEPGTDTDAVWRHEYGHILDELVPSYLNISDKDFVTSPRSLATLKQANEAFRNDEKLLFKKNAKFKSECVKEFEKEYENYKDRDSFFKYAPGGKVKKQDRAAIGAHIKLLKLEEKVNPIASIAAFEKKQKNPDVTFGTLYEEQKALLLDQKFKEQKLDKSIGYQLFKNMPDGFLKTSVGVKMLTAGNSPEAIATCTAYYLESKGKPSPGVATDLIGSLTYNKIGYGHSDDYYKSNPAFKRNTESIANIVSLYGAGDENVNAALNELAPNGFKFMKDIFKEVIDAK